MGKAVANASNAAQGWREPSSGVTMGTPTVKQPETDMGMGMGYDKKTPCYPTGNSHRKSNDDGGQMTRQRAGGMNMKHHSKHTKGK